VESFATLSRVHDGELNIAGHVGGFASFATAARVNKFDWMVQRYIIGYNMVAHTSTVREAQCLLSEKSAKHQALATVTKV
jgi:hypothetical protein